jgi:outer membrane receptor protein involved in Fe transport
MPLPARFRAFGTVCLIATAPFDGFADSENLSRPEEQERRADDAAQIQILAPVQVTATRRAVSVQDVSTAVTLIDSEKFQRTGARSVVEALRGQTGVYVQSTTPGQGIPIVRGLKGSEVLHLVDGLRINNAFFRNAPNQYPALADPFYVERVELSRGPSGALYGSDALGGVVQVLTPEVRFDGTTWSPRGAALVRFNSATLGRETHIEGAVGRAGLSLAASASWQTFEDLRGARQQRFRPSGYEAGGGDVKLIWRGGYGELLVSASYWRQPSTPRFDASNPGLGGQPAASVFSDFEPNDRLFYHLRYRARPNLLLAKTVELHLAQQLIDDDRRSQDTGSTSFDIEQNASRYNAITLQFSTGARRWLDLSYGAEVYLDTITSARRRIDIDSGAVNTRSPRFPDGSTLDSYAFFVQNVFHPTERFDITLGGRYSAFDIRLPRANEGADVALSPDDLSGNLGLLYRLTPALNAVANLGRGFRVPNIQDLGTFGNSGAANFIIPNTRLRPEFVLSYDIGLKWSTPAWQAETFIWGSDYKDRISRVNTGDTIVTGDVVRNVTQNQNSTSAELWGVELGVTRRLGVNEFYVRGNFVYGRERLADGSTEPANRIPPLNAALGAKFLHGRSIYVEPYLLYARRQDRLAGTDLTDNRIDPNGTPAYLTANLRLGYEPNSIWRFRLNVDNLGDASYREHGSGIDGPGRSATLTVEARLH